MNPACPRDPWVTSEEASRLRDAALDGDVVAIERLELLAERGSGAAMSILGAVLFMTLRGPRDGERARLLLLEASALGHGDAAHLLAALYAEGPPGVARNLDKSRRFHLRARDLGCAPGQPTFYDDIASAEREAIAAFLSVAAGGR